MSDRRLERLDPGRYRKLVSLAAGRDLPLALCDTGWNPVWSSEGCPRAGFLGALDELAADAGCEAAAVARLERDDGSLLLGAAVTGHDDAALGWVAAPVPSDGAATDTERCLEVLREVADCLGRDARLDAEIQGLAGDVADRNEELHLVYSFERSLRGRSSGLDGIALVLKDFAESLSIDVASLVLPGRPSLTCTDRDHVPVANMDLVMTQLRNNLYRFVATRRRALVLNGQDDHERRQYLFCDMPFRVLAYPILEGAEVEGMLVLLRNLERPAFSNGDLNLAGAIVQQAAMILRAQQMLEQTRRFGEQLAGSLIAAVEAKDPYTRGHSERVQGISVQLGRELGLLETELEDVYWGALLHDIGKLGVPDRILTKAGKLTEDEYTFIKEHPQRSYEILQNIEYLRTGALEGARFHQERFDGRGYPTGLAGQQIPFNARIIAVGDTYDAITTSRSYRAAAPHAKAAEEIVRVAGSQLDPDVVAAFERLCTGGTAWLTRITGERGN